MTYLKQERSSVTETSLKPAPKLIETSLLRKIKESKMFIIIFLYCASERFKGETAG